MKNPHMRATLRILMCFIISAGFGCSPNSHDNLADNAAESLDSVTNLEDARELLAEASGTSVRNYSTFDFGRDRDPNAISAIVPHDLATQVVTKVRSRLGPNLICFIGTTRWLGSEKHDGDEIVVANGESQYDILRIARSDAINYDMETEDLIKRLQEYDEQFGIEIFHAETDTVEFVLARMPTNLSAFCEDLYGFCPDIVDQGVGTMDALEEEIEQHGYVVLWWD